MDFLLHHLLRTSAARVPAKDAVVQGTSRLTYAELARQVSGLAEGLRRAGVTRRDRVGFYLDHSMSQVISLFAISRTGGVFVPINALLVPAQVAHIVSDCAMKGLVTTSAKLAQLLPALKGIPSLEFVVVADDGDVEDLPLPVYRLEELSRLAADPTAPEAAVGNDLGAILYTSGSTGKPKGVMLTHAQMIAGASIVSTYLEITEAERILSILPYSFDAGLNQLLTAIQQGGTVVLLTFTFAREIVQAMVRERITGLAGVPTLWSLLAQPTSSLAKTPLPDLRYITNTGGAMPQPVLAALRAALPSTRIFLMYGLTEAFRSTYLPPEELDRRPTSIGKAIPDTEILVVNEQGQPCRPGEVGELVHRGPTVSLGYWGRPDLTDAVLRPHPFLPPELGGDERVCYSGDLVKTDEDGFIYFVGRRDAMIKSSGFRISSTEVEEVLFQSGALRAAAVIGVPDAVLGQSIKAFVVPREGERVAPQALIEFCAGKLPRYMVPAAVEVLDDMPKTSSGKVDYPALRARESA
jgi:acyl-CoA ligase (AMP-forming) (exosortase A-associated)